MIYVRTVQCMFMIIPNKVCSFNVQNDYVTDLCVFLSWIMAHLLFIRELKRFRVAIGDWIIWIIPSLLDFRSISETDKFPKISIYAKKKKKRDLWVSKICGIKQQIVIKQIKKHWTKKKKEYSFAGYFPRPCPWKVY